MADVKWIKITTDMFNNQKIRHLRRLPDGNNIVLIWVMLLTMAGRCNASGMIFLTENIPYTPKMLADELDFEENTVRLALEALERLGMIVSENGWFTIAGWEEHQNIDGLEKIKEQNRLRKARQREKQRLLPDVSRDSHVTVTLPVTQCHATDIEKEERIKNKDYIYIVGYLNEKAGTKYRHASQKTQACIRARFEDGFTVDDFKTVIDKKCAEWIGTDFEKFLRPETLFGPKFENYLNAKVNEKKKENTGGENPYLAYDQRQYSKGELDSLVNYGGPDDF
ncbi:MAG: phage replisome organizer N-terminal domain-containing protein [Christensenellales bacterium]